MPRKARIDATGAVHHIIAKGIERRKIFFPMTRIVGNSSIVAAN
jgi:hypothetical protein